MYYITFVNFKNRAFTATFYGILIAIFISISVGVIKGNTYLKVPEMLLMLIDHILKMQILLLNLLSKQILGMVKRLE